jgi:hypothetical protein
MMNGAGIQSEYGEMQEIAAEQFEYPGEAEVLGEMLGESFEAGLQESGYESPLGEASYEAESPLSESEEMEFATELLEIPSEAELDHFLGKLIKGAWKGVRKVGSVVSRVARPLGGILKGVAKKALPFVAGAAGTFFGGPLGGMIGSKLGSMVSNALEAETEGMSLEDREVEMAKRYVRFAATAARQAAAMPSSVSPQAAARAAVVAAARRMVSASGGGVGGVGRSPVVGAEQHGTWLRRGRRIIVLGV